METNNTRLVQVISSCGHRLNALGRSMGATTSQGGAWGLMKSLQRDGPQTIPGLARSRPVSRQHIRQLAQTLISQEWIETIPNPGHKRSFLLRLTAAGEQAANTMDAQIDSLLSECLHGISPGELETTFKTLSILADRLQLRLT